MKHYIRLSSVLLLFIVLVACNNTITPLSPAVNNNQVNTPSNTNNANTTSNIDSIGGIGSQWSMFACQPGQTCLTAVNNTTSSTITVCFSSPPVPGTYQFVSSTSLLAPGKAVLTVTNPPGQTPGSNWYSISGTTSVFQTCCGTHALFTNITCLDNPSGSIDSVIVSGEVECL